MTTRGQGRPSSKARASRWYSVAIEVATWRSGRTGAPRGLKPLGRRAGRRKARGSGGKGSRARPRGRHTPRYRARRHDGSRASRAPRNDPSPARPSVPGSRARCASGAWPGARARRPRWSPARSTASISWAPSSGPLDQEPLFRVGGPTAARRDARAGPGAGEARPHRAPACPRATSPSATPKPAVRPPNAEAHGLMARRTPHPDRGRPRPPRRGFGGRGAWPGRHTVVSPLTPTA